MTASSMTKQQQADIKQLSEDLIAMAKQKGATQAEVWASADDGYSVSVRLGEVDTVEYNRDKGLSVTVYFDKRKGSASTTDTSREAIEATLDAACDIARFTAEDACAGLADAHRMAEGDEQLSLYHPWDLSVEQAILTAKHCEAQARAYDARIKNSDGADVSTHNSYSVYANSHGFMGSSLSTRHSISCMMIAEAKGQMQRDYSYTVARDPADLKSISCVAQEAAANTVARLNGKQLSTRKVPVIFRYDIATGLIGSFLNAISGGSLYRKSSFLVDHLGKAIFNPMMQIHEDPHVLKGLSSCAFDDEGVETKPRQLVHDGILQGYLLSSYSARRLGMESTGNAGGAHNIFLKTSDQDLTALLKTMDTGLLVTDVMGQGVNLVTGNYSRGASGFWVEKGEIQYPVEEITIAGNLKDMFMNIQAVGADINPCSHIKSGSLLISEMMVGGRAA